MSTIKILGPTKTVDAGPVEWYDYNQKASKVRKLTATLPQAIKDLQAVISLSLDPKLKAAHKKILKDLMSAKNAYAAMSRIEDNIYQ